LKMMGRCVRQIAGSPHAGGVALNAGNDFRVMERSLDVDSLSAVQ
jgi:hypothetical protein